jgi:hypothetical protein
MAARRVTTTRRTIRVSGHVRLGARVTDRATADVQTARRWLLDERAYARTISAATSKARCHAATPRTRAEERRFDCSARPLARLHGVHRVRSVRSRCSGPSEVRRGEERANGTCYYGVIPFPVVSDTTRLCSAQRLLTSEELCGVPFLVMGNKCDDDSAVPESTLRDALGLSFCKAVGSHRPRSP